MSGIVYKMGMPITAAGKSPEDVPFVGEIRDIVHYETGIALAWYRVERTTPPRRPGSLWLMEGVVVAVLGDGSYSAKNGAANVRTGPK